MVSKESPNAVPVASVTELRSMIGAAKRGSQSYSTNLFLTDAALDPIVAAGELAAVEASGAVVFLRREPLFDRVYYAGGERDLRDALERAAEGQARPLVTDLVGRRDAVAAVADQVKAAGFEHRTTLVRVQMTMRRELGEAAADPEVELARAEDAPAILAAIEANFDPYSDQFPPLADIELAIAAGTIVVTRVDGRLAGFFYYDRSGFSAEARYWLMLPEYRGLRALGDKLLRRFLADTASAKRNVIWVHEENRRVLAMHEYYGFTPDGIVDIVLMKQL